MYLDISMFLYLDIYILDFSLYHVTCFYLFSVTYLEIKNKKDQRKRALSMNEETKKGHRRTFIVDNKQIYFVKKNYSYFLLQRNAW